MLRICYVMLFCLGMSGKPTSHNKYETNIIPSKNHSYFYLECLVYVCDENFFVYFPIFFYRFYSDNTTHIHIIHTETTIIFTKMRLQTAPHATATHNEVKEEENRPISVPKMRGRVIFSEFEAGCVFPAVPLGLHPYSSPSFPKSTLPSATSRG